MLHALLFWPFLFLWGFHGFGTLIVILVVVGLLFGRRRYYYGYHPWDWHPGDSRSAALGTLEQRYARGEIQREEYLQKKQDLGG
ncbi:MAG: SHOCT domain-containing protein [Rhizomicrobium sp.]